MTNLSEYGYFRLGVASPEIQVANPNYNADKIIQIIEEASAKECRLVLFPELSLTSYTAGDLFFQKRLEIETREALKKIAKKTEESRSAVAVGAPLWLDGKIFNCAYFIARGSLLGAVPKTYLCNSNEYYEERWFSSEFDRTSDSFDFEGEEVPFGANLIFELETPVKVKIGLEICEDLWTVKPPSLDMALAGAQILLNLSASNEYLSKTAYRRELIKTQSARCLAAYALSSSGPSESTTDTVFSSHCAIAEYGKIKAETKKFVFGSQLIVSDIDVERLNFERIKNNSFGGSLPDKIYDVINFSLPETKSSELYAEINRKPFLPDDKTERDEVCQEILKIQSTALARRIKAAKAKTAIVGISGGLDSSLALIATVEALKLLSLKPSDAIAATMPGFGTAKNTRSNALKLAKALGVKTLNIPIGPSVKRHLADISHSEENRDIVYENAQARERTQILFDLANKFNGLVVGTGDLSEIALGWNTYGGDHLSSYSVNAGVPKTLVKAVIEWAAENLFDKKTAQILKQICDTPISPELLPPDENGQISQKTEEILGPYEVHDFFLYYFVRLGFSPKKIFFLAKKAFRDVYSEESLKNWLKIFVKRFFANQFKRSCLPDGPKIGAVSLSPRADWRMPSDASPEIWLKEIEEL